MYRSILVPLDGSSFAEQALPLAAAIARKSKARLLLVTVCAPLAEAYVEGMYFSTAELEDDLAARYGSYLRAAADDLRLKADVPVETAVLRGEVAATLCEHVGGGNADLVVMATHGRGPLGRFWLGSVADEMLRLSPVPLLLVRPEEKPASPGEPGFGRVVVPLDGTPEAEGIIEPAVDLAALSPEAEIVLMRAIHTVVPAPTPPDTDQAAKEASALLGQLLTAQERLRGEAEKYLDGVAGRLRARGLRVRTEVIAEDSPVTAILDEAAKEHASLIALYTHARRGLSRLLLGSVADKVIRGAHVPVLVQRPRHG